MRSIPLMLAMTLGVCGGAVLPACGQVATDGRFVRDPARFKAKQDQIVAAMRQQSPQLAGAVQQLFAQDVLATISPAMRRLGLDDQNVVDMTAAYWVTAWEASHGIVGRETDPAIVRGARDQIARTMSGATARMSEAKRQDVADTMLLQAVLIEARMGAAAKGGAQVQRKMSDAIHAEAAQLLKTDLRKVELTASGFGAAGAAPEGAPPAPAVAASAGNNAGNWAQVDGVYFKSYTTFGVGGMVIQDFEPVVLFRDGSYYEVEGDALEDVDLAASRRAKPRNWGRWRKQGATFLLTDERGKTNDYQLQQGAFFQAYPAEASKGRLNAAYKRVSGGGNSALGGTMTIAAQTNLTFSPDGRFATRSSAGAVGANVSASSRKQGGIGSYRIERHTVTFTDPDGSTRRQFFALGSEGTPARPDDDLIFLGDRVYVKDD